MTDEPILMCRDVACGYDRDRPVLSSVSVAVRSGEILTILGGSGSGKSTLLRTLSGLLRPLAGKVMLFGSDLYAVGHRQRAELLRHAGMLFQREALFGSWTVLQNVMFPARELTDVLEPIARELARTKLAQLGVADLAARHPDQISGGQRKRVALARALILDPALVFCDEPTSGLDPVTAQLIDEKLLFIRDAFQIAVIAVTHDIASVRRIADRVLVLAHGEIAASGSVAEVENSMDGDVYALFHRPEEHAHPPGEGRIEA
jgi:phospholipid/cholesterol/gamma-HCH transport system ATP-binding protein